MLCVVDFSASLFALPVCGVAQASILPPSGIVAWWPFDESSGTIATDVVGGNNRPVVQLPKWQAWGKAVGKKLEDMVADAHFPIASGGTATTVVT